MSIALGPHNTMVQNGASSRGRLQDLSVLEGLGYTVVPIAKLKVINANPFSRHPDPPLRWLSDSGQYDAVLSGPDTRLVAGKYPRPPNGPVYRNGGLDTQGNGRAHHRGTVAVLADGSVVMGRSEGATGPALRQRFGFRGNDLDSAIGGGALLIENGRMVDHLDLLGVQLFDDGDGGLRARTMRVGVHSMMGIRKGRAYAAWCNARSALAIRTDFKAAGFGTLIKFAHGSSVFYDDCVDRLNGQNGTGFGVLRAR